MASQTSALPLAHVRVLDLGVGMVAGIAVKLLGDCGAEVERIESAAGDPFHAVYPAYAAWQAGKRIRRAEADPDQWFGALEAADICVVGGEDHPGLDWRFDVEGLAARLPGLVILDLGGRFVGSGREEAPAVDLLAQARCGHAYEHYGDRPFVSAFPAPTYGAALIGTAAALAALHERRASGRGQVVRTTLSGGGVTWLASLWSGMPGIDRSFPKDPRQLIFACADGRYIQIAPGVPGGLKLVHDTLGIPTPPTSIWGNYKDLDDPRKFWGDTDLIAPYVARSPSGAVVATLRAAGLPVEFVEPPGGCWDHPQVRHNGSIVAGVDGGRRVGPAIRFAMPDVPDHAGPQVPAPAAHPASGGPLAGIRILDMGGFVAGPFTSQSLADMGADVIKVETARGDISRSNNQTFVANNRGKRSIVVNLKERAGLELVHRLCRDAHVVHHNFRPGVSARLGIDGASLRRINPALTVLETSAYGADGPLSHLPGLDMIFQALCGLQHRGGGGTGASPLWYRTCIIDYAGGMLGSIGALCGLLASERSGQGIDVHVSLLGTGLFLLSELVQRPDGSFAGADPVDPEQMGFHPAERLYQARDGWVAVAARDDAMAGRLSAALALQPACPPERGDWGAAEAGRIAAAIGGYAVGDLLARLDAHDVWAAPCRRQECLRFAADGVVHDDVAPGTQRPEFVPPMYGFSRSRMAPSGRIPDLGAHGDAVLAETGLDAAAVDALRRAGVVG